MLKQILIIICFLFITGSLIAQNNDEWLLIKTTNDVSVYYKKSTCHAQELLAVKFVNNKDQGVKVTWSLWNGVQAKATYLDAKQTKEGACNSTPAFMLLDKIPEGLTTNDINASITIQVQ